MAAGFSRGAESDRPAPPLFEPDADAARAFEVPTLAGDLTGAPYTPVSEWPGLVTRKR